MKTIKIGVQEFANELHTLIDTQAHNLVLLDMCFKFESLNNMIILNFAVLIQKSIIFLFYFIRTYQWIKFDS